MNAHLQRAMVLFDQSRPDLAEPELRLALAAEPGHALAHALLARCLAARGELMAATEEARAAIASEPAWAGAHAALAEVLSARNQFDHALRSAEEAVRLEPDDARYHGLTAMVQLQRRDWSAALRAANVGLQQDAENVACNNARAMALTKLGRNAEAGATLEETLAHDPDNAFSHANAGWAALHQGRTDAALDHFREALRLEPGLDFARAGLVEALKSKSVIYGLMLKYFLWMGRLSRGAQWAVVIGAYIFIRVLSAVADKNPEWSPWLRPVFVVYVIFAAITWFAGPLFNLLLRLNRHGRYALSDDQRRGSTWFGVGLTIVALCGLGVAVYGTESLSLIGLVYFGFLLMPVSAIHACPRGWPRRMMMLYTAGLAALGPLFFVLAEMRHPAADGVLQLFLFGNVLSGLVANYLMMQVVRS